MKARAFINKLSNSTVVSAGYNFPNGQFENALDYATYKNTAQVLPVTGIGTGASVTLALTTDSLIGLQSGLFSKDANNRQGEGFSKDFTIDPGQTTSPAQITFTYKTPVAYQDGYLGVFLYDKTNGALIRMSVENIPATYGSISQFLTTFIPSTSLEYRLIFHVITDTAPQWTFTVDNIQVGQKNVAVGAAIGNWIEYQSTISGLGAGSGTILAMYRRVGSLLEGRIAFTKDGTDGSGAAEVQFSIPTGLTIISGQSVVGQGIWRDAVNSNNWKIAGAAYSTSNNIFLYEIGSLTAVTGVDMSRTSDININFTVPIAQWTSNVNMASDFTEYASNSNTGAAANTSYSTGMVNGTEGSPILALNSTTNSGFSRTTYQITFTRPIQPTDILILETNINGRWAPVSSGAAQVMLLFTQGAASYGMGLGSQIDSRSLYVEFGNSGRTNEGSTYSSPGGTWAFLAGFGFRWRVRKVSNGNMAETRNDFITAVGGERIHKKVFTGTTAAAANGETTLATGLDQSKILSIYGQYRYASTFNVPFESTEVNGTLVAHIHVYVNADGTLILYNSGTANSSVWSKPFTCVIEYME